MSLIAFNCTHSHAVFGVYCYLRQMDEFDCLRAYKRECGGGEPGNEATVCARGQTNQLAKKLVSLLIDIYIRLYRDWKRTHKNIHVRCGLGSVNSPYIVCY